MDSHELAELQRLMKKASEAGLMDGAKTQGGGKAQSISSPATVKGGAMTDACKRRKNEPEELSSDSEWDATVGRSSDSPAIDNQARYVTEGDTVVAKPMKKDVSVAVKTPDTSHVRHVDKSIAVPPGVADFKIWSQTVIVMDKYADLNLSFSELLAAGEGDAKIARYISWDCWHLRHTCRQRPAEPGGRFWHVCQSLRLEAQAERISTKDQVNP